MRFLSSIVILLSWGTCLAIDITNVFDRFAAVKQRAVRNRTEQIVSKRQSEDGTTGMQYLNEKFKPFAVDGTKIPDVDFDVGESYAGLLPISNRKGESRKLYFWFFPSTNSQAGDEIAIWLTGGFGCSSLTGLLTENGPFLYQAGTLAPVSNPYAWNKLTNYVWIDQPVGTGFSQGKPDISNEIELASQFKGFWKNFVDTFKLHGRKVYITGESFAGFHVSYIANEFLKEKNRNYFNINGIAINDPIIGDQSVQLEVPSFPFVEYWNQLLLFNDTTVAQARSLNAQCGFTEYYAKHFTFPAAQKHFPPVPSSNDPKCDIASFIVAAAFDINPCFNYYHITDSCPFPYSHLGIANPGDYSPPGAVVYFDRTDVKKAINAPVNTTWYQCAQKSVFPNGDSSPGPALDGTLSAVIEATKNVIIGSGALDFTVPTNGTLFALQNLTWGGYQGFQKRPATPLYIPFHPEPNRGAMGEAGTVGTWGKERGLTFYEIRNAGHMLPGYSLSGGYRSIEVLLGRVPDFSSTEPLSGF